MSTIESVLHENRLFSAAGRASSDRRTSPAWPHIKRCATRRARLRRLLGAPRAGASALAQAVQERAGRNQRHRSSSGFTMAQLNASYNCLDRHLDHAASTRSPSSSRPTTAPSPRSPTNSSTIASASSPMALKSLGHQGGDRVIIYMPMSIEAVVAMQACARIGATHSVVFGGFSAKSLHERIIDAGAVAVITADGQHARRQARSRSSPRSTRPLRWAAAMPSSNVVVYKRTGSHIQLHAPRDIWWDDLVRDQPDVCEPTWVDAEHPLFILYTSGSTGKPKGVQHSTAGYLLQAHPDDAVDLRPSTDDIFWCTADVGWVTGHSYWLTARWQWARRKSCSKACPRTRMPDVSGK